MLTDCFIITIVSYITYIIAVCYSSPILKQFGQTISNKA